MSQPSPTPPVNSSFSFVGMILSPFRSIAGYVIGYFHKRADFDHKFRLEKEEPLYRDLWEELFELRRSAASFIEDGVTLGVVESHEVRTRKYLDAFNQCQATTRRNSPFIHESVYKPLREAIKAANHIGTCHARRRRIEDMRRHSMGSSDDIVSREWEENESDVEVTLQQLEAAVNEVEAAMRSRVFLIR